MLVARVARHLGGGEGDVQQVAAQCAREGAAQDGQEFVRLLLAGEGEGLVEPGHDLALLVHIAAHHMGDVGLALAVAAADFGDLFFVHGDVFLSYW